MQPGQWPSRTRTLSGAQGSGMLDAIGKRRVSTHVFAAGTHSVTASYWGDASYNPSTSAAINFTVQKAGTTTVTTSDFDLFRLCDCHCGHPADRGELFGPAPQRNHHIYGCDQRCCSWNERGSHCYAGCVYGHILQRRCYRGSSYAVDPGQQRHRRGVLAATRTTWRLQHRLQWWSPAQQAAETVRGRRLGLSLGWEHARVGRRALPGGTSTTTVSVSPRWRFQRCGEPDMLRGRHQQQ